MAVSDFQNRSFNWSAPMKAVRLRNGFLGAVTIASFSSAPLAQTFLSVKNPATIEPWKSLLVQNTAGVLPNGIPLFLSQGLSDGLVRPGVTQAYKDRLCKAGSKVKLLLMPGVSHGFIG
jgi:acetyl esterase/lipase